MKALVINQSGERSPRAWIERWAAALGRELCRKRHALSAKKELVVVFVDAKEMRRMNKTYRGKDYATDVLSFESADPSSLGELVLCLPVIRSQSKRTGLSARGELGYMIVHGVLHLLGYDHEGRRDGARMFALQDELFGRLEKSVGLR
jgi:probable rRNA maturation factor